MTLEQDLVAANQLTEAEIRRLNMTEAELRENFKDVFKATNETMMGLNKRLSIYGSWSQVVSDVQEAVHGLNREVVDVKEAKTAILKVLRESLERNFKDYVVSDIIKQLTPTTEEVGVPDRVDLGPDNTDVFEPAKVNDVEDDDDGIVKEDSFFESVDSASILEDALSGGSWIGPVNLTDSEDVYMNALERRFSAVSFIGRVKHGDYSAAFFLIYKGGDADNVIIVMTPKGRAETLISSTKPGFDRALMSLKKTIVKAFMGAREVKIVKTTPVDKEVKRLLDKHVEESADPHGSLGEGAELTVPEVNAMIKRGLLPELKKQKFGVKAAELVSKKLRLEDWLQFGLESYARQVGEGNVNKSSIEKAEDAFGQAFTAHVVAVKIKDANSSLKKALGFSLRARDGRPLSRDMWSSRSLWLRNEPFLAVVKIDGSSPDDQNKVEAVLKKTELWKFLKKNNLRPSVNKNSLDTLSFEFLRPEGEAYSKIVDAFHAEMADLSAKWYRGLSESVDSPPPVKIRPSDTTSFAPKSSKDVEDDDVEESDVVTEAAAKAYLSDDKKRLFLPRKSFGKVYDAAKRLAKINLELDVRPMTRNALANFERNLRNHGNVDIVDAAKVYKGLEGVKGVGAKDADLVHTALYGVFEVGLKEEVDLAEAYGTRGLALKIALHKAIELIAYDKKKNKDRVHDKALSSYWRDVISPVFKELRGDLKKPFEVGVNDVIPYIQASDYKKIRTNPDGFSGQFLWAKFTKAIKKAGYDVRVLGESASLSEAYGTRKSFKGLRGSFSRATLEAFKSSSFAPFNNTTGLSRSVLLSVLNHWIEEGSEFVTPHIIGDLASKEAAPILAKFLKDVKKAAGPHLYISYGHSDSSGWSKLSAPNSYAVQMRIALKPEARDKGFSVSLRSMARMVEVLASRAGVEVKAEILDDKVYFDVNAIPGIKGYGRFAEAFKKWWRAKRATEMGLGESIEETVPEEYQKALEVCEAYRAMTQEERESLTVQAMRGYLEAHDIVYSDAADYADALEADDEDDEAEACEEAASSAEALAFADPKGWIERSAYLQAFFKGMNPIVADCWRRVIEDAFYAKSRSPKNLKASVKSALYSRLAEIETLIASTKFVKRRDGHCSMKKVTFEEARVTFECHFNDGVMGWEILNKITKAMNRKGYNVRLSGSEKAASPEGFSVSLLPRFSEVVKDLARANVVINKALEAGLAESVDVPDKVILGPDNTDVFEPAKVNDVEDDDDGIVKEDSEEFGERTMSVKAKKPTAKGRKAARHLSRGGNKAAQRRGRRKALRIKKRGGTRALAKKKMQDDKKAGKGAGKSLKDYKRKLAKQAALAKSRRNNFKRVKVYSEDRTERSIVTEYLDAVEPFLDLPAGELSEAEVKACQFLVSESLALLYEETKSEIIEAAEAEPGTLSQMYEVAEEALDEFNKAD